MELVLSIVYLQSLYDTFSPTAILYNHMGLDDRYIVSCGLVVDERSQRLMGSLYGAGPVTTLDENEIFGVWLQKRVLFKNSDVILGVGEAARAYGPDNVRLLTEGKPVVGQFYLYAEDYVDIINPGKLIEISPTVTITPGDIWQYTQ